jgi:hypothetical protein
MTSGDNIIAIRDDRGRFLKGMPGGPGRPVGSRNKLSEDFLRDLQADWEQHGKDILEVMREKHPEIYFQCIVKLALVHPVELYPAGGSNRRQTPEEIMAKLEERVGLEGRKMFERFMRRVRRLEEQQLTTSTAQPSTRTTGRLRVEARQTATTNPYGVRLNRAWTEWVAEHGVSETIAAALYLVSRNKKADEVVVKLTAGEVERVTDIVQRWPDYFPPGALVALKESRPTPQERSAGSGSPGVRSAR